jgi:hypothetical protein
MRIKPFVRATRSLTVSALVAGFIFPRGDRQSRAARSVGYRKEQDNP